MKFGNILRFLYTIMFWKEEKIKKQKSVAEAVD